MKWIVLFLAIAGSANADSTPCWSDFPKIENPGFKSSQIESRDVSVTVTNTSGSSIETINLEFELWVAERPRAISWGIFRGLIKIPGGLLPGETITTTDYHFMEPREVAFAENAEAIDLRLIFKSIKTIEGERLECS